MAKLNDVKTIDMVNGEITKVEYAGDFYVKTAEHPQKGDLMLETDTDALNDVSNNAFYKIIGLDCDNDPEFLDDVNDINALDLTHNGASTCFFFRKAKPSLSSVFTDAGRKPNEYRKGDIVRIIGNGYGSNNAIEDVGEVTEVNDNDIIRVQVNGKAKHSNWSLSSDAEPLVFVENRLDRN